MRLPLRTLALYVGSSKRRRRREEDEVEVEKGGVGGGGGAVSRVHAMQQYLPLTFIAYADQVQIPAGLLLKSFSMKSTATRTSACTCHLSRHNKKTQTAVHISTYSGRAPNTSATTATTPTCNDTHEITRRYVFEKTSPTFLGQNHQYLKLDYTYNQLRRLFE